MTHWLGRFLGETQLNLLRLLRRSRRTIAGLSGELGLTDNAVRTHVAALGRDGLVATAGAERDTGGKPAKLYALTAEGEELFPKGYAAVLTGMTDELTRRYGRAETEAVLRAIGQAVAGDAPRAKEAEARIAHAIRLLHGLGGDAEAAPTADGWLIQGHGCPLSAVTAARPEVCATATAIVASATGYVVTQRCEYADGPRCAFHVDTPVP